MFCGKDALKNFAKVRPEACNCIKKETPTQLFYCEFCEICKNTFFTEQRQWLLLAVRLESERQHPAEVTGNRPEVFCKKGSQIIISPNSQEKSCARVSFLIKMQNWGLKIYLKRDSAWKSIDNKKYHCVSSVVSFSSIAKSQSQILKCSIFHK